MPDKHFDTIVVGAGFSGIGFAYHLKRRNLDNFLILEQAQELGGVWRENTYPGAACDAPSHLYSYSFATSFPWSGRFAPQHEIQTYLNQCADDFALKKHIRFGTKIKSASYLETTGTWRLETFSHGTYTCRALVWAVGQLNRPKIPDITGQEGARQVAFHSAEWRHDIDLAGKKVAVIGTGSSAIQFAPRIAKLADALTIFQRSPGYIRPKPDLIYSPKQMSWLKAFPILRKLDRLKFYLINEYRLLTFEHEKRNRLARGGFRASLSRQVPDPGLQSRLTPDYPLGCKRGLPSNEWLPMFSRSNVTLETGRIAEIHPQGIRMEDGRTHPADVIIYATGFKTTAFLEPIVIKGRGGLPLARQWETGAQAYLGMTVSNFPNMFILYGPNTNLGHTSVVYMLESQFRYIAKAITYLLGGNRSMEVLAEIENSYNADLQAKLGRTVMVTGGCTSWFKNDAGKVINNWPGFSFLYRWRTRRFNPSDYRIE